MINWEKKLCKKIKALKALNFEPEVNCKIIDEVYVVGSPYPESIICRWFATNGIDRILIEEKILSCIEVREEE
jgi:hypothetical protein